MIAQLIMALSVVLGAFMVTHRGFWFGVAFGFQCTLVAYASLRWWRARAAYLKTRDTWRE